MQNNLCILPWIGIEAQALGFIRPCCLYEGYIMDGDNRMSLNTATLNEAFHSEYMQNLRQQFRNGEKPNKCKKCWDDEAAGRRSKRKNSLEYITYDEVNYTSDLPNKIHYLDLKLGNICNLSCRICGSWSSTNLIKENALLATSDEEIDVIQSRFKSGQWPRNNDRFWEDLLTIMPNVTVLEMTGGEPFLIKQQFELLQQVIDAGYAKNIHLHYNTNGTILPTHAFELWPHFKKVNIAFSVDNLEKRFEFERKGAVWDEVINNIQSINDFKMNHPNIITQVCVTVNIMNILNLNDVCGWILDQNFDSLYFNVLHFPYSLNIGYMTDAAKKLVVNKLQNDKFIVAHQPEIEGIIRFIQYGPGSDGSKFRKQIRAADLYRNEDFAILYPEMAKAMGYSKYE